MPDDASSMLMQFVFNGASTTRVQASLASDTLHGIACHLCMRAKGNIYRACNRDYNATCVIREFGVGAFCERGLEQIASQSALKAFKAGSGAPFLKALSALDRFLHSGCAFQLISFSAEKGGEGNFRSAFIFDANAKHEEIRRATCYRTEFSTSCRHFAHARARERGFFRNNSSLEMQIETLETLKGYFLFLLRASPFFQRNGGDSLHHKTYSK